MRRLIVIMLLGLMTTLSLPAFAIAGSRENDHAPQPYKYIGKELDRTHALNWYDHGARHYDPVTRIIPMAYRVRLGLSGGRCGGAGKWDGGENTGTANNKKVLRNSLGLSALQDGLEPTTP